jgi:excisionase family DNA binding protein
MTYYDNDELVRRMANRLEVIDEKLKDISDKIDKKIKSTWLSVKEVMIVTGLSRSTINRAIQKGELVSVIKGGKRMIKRDWIDKWIQG